MNYTDDLTVKDVIDILNSNGMIYPMPIPWNNLWKRLPDTKRLENGQWNIPLPLILSAWSSPASLKKNDLLNTFNMLMIINL